MRMLLDSGASVNDLTESGLTPLLIAADRGHNAQCADNEVRNAIERTPYIVVLKFHVFILISKSFNFRSSLDRILRYLTKT